MAAAVAVEAAAAAAATDASPVMSVTARKIS
jgi:hypothetical protein